MSGPALRVVQEDEPTVGEGSVSAEMESANRTLPFDPELDLGAIEEEETDRIAESRRPAAKSGSALGRMVRWVAYGFGGLVMVLVVLVLFMRGNKAPGDVPPVTAKVDVLEAAMQAQNEPVVADTLPPSVSGESASAASTPDFQPPIALAAAPEVASVGAASSANDEILAVIEELRQVTNTLRDGFAEQQAHIYKMQGDLASLQNSSEATNMRVDGIAADFAQLRRTLDDMSSEKGRQVATLQRQLTAQKRQLSTQKLALDTQKAVRQEKPPFLLTGVTVWGTDYLATVSANGMSRDLGQGDIFDGWKVTSLSASSMTLVRLQDGVNATLSVGN